jgi:diguanylate cyclase
MHNDISTTGPADPPAGSARGGASPAHRSSAFSPLAELPAAIDSGQLALLYQPKIDLATTQVAGVEALIRWRHPLHGLIQPAAFVPLLERAGAIGPLTDWVVDAALAQLERWSGEQMPLDVSINVSASDLLDPHLADTLAGGVHRHHVAADSVRVELTQCMREEDGSHRARAARHLARTGVLLSLDDYGTRHWSLLDVTELPVDELKISRPFIRDMVRSDKVAAIVQSTIDLGRALGVAVVAQGIEDAEQWNLLKRMGCSHGQGFLFSPPLTAWALKAWLERWPYGRVDRRRRHP